jgi:hypothetical protein
VSDFDDFLGETDRPIDPPWRGGYGLRFEKQRSRQPLAYQLTKLIPVPDTGSKPTPTSNVVQGNVTCARLYQAAKEALEILDIERRELLQKVQELEKQYEELPNYEIRCIWVINE